MQATNSTEVLLQKRKHYHIYNGNISEENNERPFTFNVNMTTIESEDKFQDDLLLLSFPIEYFPHVKFILQHFNLNDNYDNFIKQCKDVIAVAENHQNESGGKMSFQSLFHNIPESICSVNDTAVVVLAINPTQDPIHSSSPVNYHIAGYIHANLFEFQPYKDSNKTEKGYYYNMLRISEREENGVKIYRRMKVFSLMFSILNSIGKQNNVDIAFACMGKENESIKRALHSNAQRFGQYYERIPFMAFSKVNRFYGSKKYNKQIVEITHDVEMLKKMYRKIDKKMSNYLFYNQLSEDQFISFIKKLTSYSKSSGVFMIPDSKGEILTATVAVNWGDFFMFQIQNPKGLFKAIRASGVMKKFLRFLMSVGEAQDYKKLIKGLSYKFHKEHNVGVTFLASYDGDPYFKVSKSIIDDKYIFFTICRNEKTLKAYKEQAIDEHGILRMFIDHPII